MSKATHTIETDVFGIRTDNLKDKLEPHFELVRHYVEREGIHTAKMVTRIRELTDRELSIYTDIDGLNL